MDNNFDESNLNKETASLGEQMTHLYDDFTKYCEINAFLAHAFASVINEHEWLTPETISGARRCSNWVQERGTQLKETLRQVHERYCSEQADNQAQ